jgi:hypothetical protein
MALPKGQEALAMELMFEQGIKDARSWCAENGC